MKVIKIRRLENSLNDYELLEKWCKEKEVYENFEQRVLNLEEIKNKYYPRTLKNASVPVYMILYNNQEVGIIQYKLVNSEDKKLYSIPSDAYEIDIFLGDKSFHNKGIGSYAINLLTVYLKKFKKAKLLVMCPLKTNLKAINCYKKSGFEIKKYFINKDTIGNNKTYALMLKKLN